MSEQKPMTYEGSGVNYDVMDAFKRAAQAGAADTACYALRLGAIDVAESRGESAYLMELPTCYLAQVEEGLGTKCLVADYMYGLADEPYYFGIGQDTVAMIVNDMITLGALPLSIAMHLAVGDSEWFKDDKRYLDLIYGWQYACELAGCAWGGGETPTLKDIIIPGTVVLSGSAMGIIQPKKRRIIPRIQDDDQIIIFTSSGIHANGLTLARKIADKLPRGYSTLLNHECTYGEALLDPTFIYVPLVEACLKNGVDIHYAVNITGHGWRKLMRAEGRFEYVIEKLPPPLPIFDFIQEHGPVDDREAYGNLNMGAGFAIYVPPKDVDLVLRLTNDSHKSQEGLNALRAGYIRTSEEKKVIIKPKNLEYAGSTLGVR